MNELESIKKLVASKIKNHNYTDEEVGRLLTILNNLYLIGNNANKVSVLENDLMFLQEKGFIELSDVMDIRASIIVSEYHDLPDDMIKKILTILGNIYEKINVLKESIEHNEYQELLNKINKGLKNLNDKDIDNLMNLIKNSELEFSVKKSLLIFLSFNLIKFNDEYQDDFDNIENSNKGITEEECIELFNKYGYSFKEMFSSENKSTIINKGNYQQIDDILALLKEKNINLNTFISNINKQNNFTIILIKSNNNCIKRVLDFSSKYHLYEKEDGIDFASMINKVSKFILRKITYKKKERKKPSESSDSEYIHGSHQDFFKNVEFFEEMCERVHPGYGLTFISRFYEKHEGDLLECYSHDKILEADRVLKLYGIEEKDYFRCATSAFSSSNHADTIDFMIEIDLLDYLLNNPSTFATIGAISHDVLFIASKNKAHNFEKKEAYDFIGKPFTKIVFKDNAKAQISNLLEENPKIIPDLFINSEEFKSEEYKNIAVSFDDLIESDSIDFDIVLEEINNPKSTSIVKVLEENFRSGKYLYVIGGVRISRLKVLRIYNTFLKKERELTEKISDEKTKLCYAIARKSYITEDEMALVLDEIRNIIKQREV